LIFHRHLHRSLLAATLVAGAAPHASFAQDPASASMPWSLGLGVATAQRPYAGTGNRTLGFPLVAYENDWVRLAGIGFDLKLTPTAPLSFALRARFALGDGYKAGDAPLLAGMGDRKGSLWVGPAVQWNTDLANVSFEVLGDALRRSKGIEGKLGLERGFRAGPFVFSPHAAADFLDRKAVDYYYGVSAAQATSARAAYAGRATVNLEGGLRTVFLFNPSNSLFLDVNATAYGKGITDSPLVDRQVAPGAVLGYAYRF
jgi:outer membrane protein